MSPSTLLIALLACETAPYTSGASEPIFVREGTFHAGELPVDVSAETPEVIYSASVGYVLTQGQGGVVFSGLSSADTYSVAVAFEGVGSGYWVVPVDGPDVTQDNNLLFDLTIDVNKEVPYGLQTLTFVAIDGQGHAGPPYKSTVCVLPDVADGNFSACSDQAPPNSAVLSLSWNTQADLDLIIIAPNGKLVSNKAPTTALPGDDGEVSREDLDAEFTGTLSRDSNGGCTLDGIRVESLVFPGEPSPGEYQIYANLYSPCFQPAVNFALTLYQRVDGQDGTWPVERTELAMGQLLALQANGGQQLGTFLTTVTFP